MVTTERELLQAMRTLEPGADRGALVGTRDLRAKCGLPKDVFDYLALLAARRGYVSLHEHDYPASLTDDERAQLVYQDARATVWRRERYFVGVAITLRETRR